MRSLRIFLLAASVMTLAVFSTTACNYRSAMTNLVTASAAETAEATASETAAQDEQQGAEFRWRGAVAAGRVVEIKGVNGGVRAEGTAAGGEVEVVATKRGRRSAPESVRVEVVPHADGVTICAVYPSPDPSKPNTCEPGAGGRSNVRDNDVHVDFVVRVPAGVRFHGQTVNGGVEADGIAANVEARTVNGEITVSTSGYARASTVNGSIKATMRSFDWDRSLEFSTINGGINLSFPDGLSADVEAETLNGDISTDFQMTLQGRVSRRKLSAQIGGGGRRSLRLKTINGDIEIKRAS
ncbi:MAG TPA: DUF4097 family beta strand repeat-containing protein [Pyrinomonadaceae bacterium]|nr:DUF4097 family beta strand repeat-containing protein [Pyrinomonadaceae bacterium]